MNKSRRQDPLAPIASMSDGAAFVRSSHLASDLGVAYETLWGGVGRNEAGRLTDESVRVSAPQAPLLSSIDFTEGETGPRMPEAPLADPPIYPQRAWRSFSPIHAEELTAHGGGQHPAFLRFESNVLKPRSYEEVLAIRRGDRRDTSRPLFDPSMYEAPSAADDLPMDPKVVEVMRAAGKMPAARARPSEGRRAPLRPEPLGSSEPKRSVSSFFSEPPAFEVRSDAETSAETSVPEGIPSLQPQRVAETKRAAVEKTRAVTRQAAENDARATQVAMLRAEARFYREAAAAAESENRRQVPPPPTPAPPTPKDALDPRLNARWEADTKSHETIEKISGQFERQMKEQERRHQSDLRDIKREIERWRS